MNDIIKQVKMDIIKKKAKEFESDTFTSELVVNSIEYSKIELDELVKQFEEYGLDELVDEVKSDLDMIVELLNDGSINCVAALKVSNEYRHSLFTALQDYIEPVDDVYMEV